MIAMFPNKIRGIRSPDLQNVWKWHLGHSRNWCACWLWQGDCYFLFIIISYDSYCYDQIIISWGLVNQSQTSTPSHEHSCQYDYSYSSWAKWTGHASLRLFWNNWETFAGAFKNPAISNGITPTEPVEPTCPFWLVVSHQFISIFADFSFRFIFFHPFLIGFAPLSSFFAQFSSLFMDFSSVFTDFSSILPRKAGKCWKAWPSSSQEVSCWPGAWIDPLQVLQRRNCRSTAFRRFLGVEIGS